MCDSGGEPISYEQLMPPEAIDFRKLLYSYIGGENKLFEQGAPQYPGQLPFTAPPGQGQMAGMNTILALMGYGPYQPEGIPSAPPQNIYPDVWKSGDKWDEGQEDRHDYREDKIEERRENRKKYDDPYAPRKG